MYIKKGRRFFIFLKSNLSDSNNTQSNVTEECFIVSSGYKLCLMSKCTVESGLYSENISGDWGPLREAIAFEFRSVRLHTKSIRTEAEMDAILVGALWKIEGDGDKSVLCFVICL
jgi:hypothetical protein